MKYYKSINNISFPLVLAMVVFAMLSACCEREKTVPEQQAPLSPTDGAINARYTVGDGRTVVFAKGNLQYRSSAGRWRFADKQYTILGKGNENVDTIYDGWIDLFGWGTSGYRGRMPYMVDDNASHYGTDDAMGHIAGTNYDWGRFAVIEGGGTSSGLWRTLTHQEWQHLLLYRDEASAKKGLATIVGAGPTGKVFGLVLLPDSWKLPEGCSFNPGQDSGYATNRYTLNQWNHMENAGALFLPAAGYRCGKKVELVNEYGCYWSSSRYDSYTARDLFFYSGDFGLGTSSRSNGECVRLVQDK